jgi:hypothetical protein
MSDVEQFLSSAAFYGQGEYAESAMISIGFRLSGHCFDGLQENVEPGLRASGID